MSLTLIYTFAPCTMNVVQAFSNRLLRPCIHYTASGADTSRSKNTPEITIRESPVHLLRAVVCPEELSILVSMFQKSQVVLNRRLGRVSR